ncbi:putative ATP-dependent DNA helicase YjcD [Clostridiales bacterium]|nr:putative ATP-dependent DNA helicase YjcD [Clostridiales bacterium]
MSKLNENQIKAVKHVDGPMLVLSGPGSGKTTVITQRLLYMTKKCGIRPEDILTVTFTKAAAIEMENRYKRVGGMEGAVFSTFHALFFRILREYFSYSLGSLISETDKRTFLEQTVENYGIETDDIDQTVNTFLLNYGLIKNDLQQPDAFEPREMSKEEFWALFKIYEAHKERNEKIDFDDMMSNCYYLFLNNRGALNKWRKKYKYMQIDEFQDINRAQYECVKMLAYPHNNVFAVGDDDQSIYSFRGARPEFMKLFEKEMKGCKRSYLDINYRSTDQIVAISERLIAKNKNRFNKTITGTGRKGALPAFFFAESSEKEVDRVVDMICDLHDKKSVPYGEMAIIYRDNLSGNPYARRLVKKGIPYFLKDNTYNVYDHWIAKDICSYIDFIYNTSDDEAFERIVNKPLRYVSKNVIEAAKRMGMSTFYGVMNTEALGQNGRKAMETLYESIQRARKLKANEQARYIYKGLEYGRYLSSYAAYKKCSSVFLEQIAEEIISIAGELDDLQELRSLLSDYKYKIANAPVPKLGDDAVTLTTIHSAKGLEFGTVFIPSIVETMLPHGNPKADYEVEEERRLFYVAITRAKKRLVLSAFGKDSLQSKAKLSRFAEELGIKKKD